jgi:hypothetical protein
MRSGSLLAPLFALLAIAAGLFARRRLRREREPAPVTDDVVRQIEDTGQIETSEREPLDLGEIRSEEDAFWEQTWDEPEEL